MATESTPKIAFFSNRECYRRNDECYYDGANGRLIAILQKNYPGLSLAGYTDPHQRDWYNMAIQPKAFYGLPYLNTFANGLRYHWKVIKFLKQLAGEHDVLIIQLPFKSFLAPLFIRKPIVFHICSNLRTAAANPVKYRGWRRWLARFYAEVFHFAHKLYVNRKNTRLIAHGSELGQLYSKKHSHVVVSTSIYENELIQAAGLPVRNQQFKLLFVGRPSLEKGFDTLLQALQLLKEKTKDFQVHCIGFDAKTFEQTWKNTLPKTIVPHITFLGEIPFSRELFDQFRKADVLILPSRSEGTPRVLVEARAFGCPVIATKIGGIPDSVADGRDGLLFEVGSAEQLADHILRLMDDESYRQQLRLNGLHSVKNKMTLEKFVEPFIKSINELVNNEQ